MWSGSVLHRFSIAVWSGIAPRYYKVGNWYCTELAGHSRLGREGGRTFAEQQLGPVTDAQVCKDREEDDSYDDHDEDHDDNHEEDHDEDHNEDHDEDHNEDHNEDHDEDHNED